MSSTPLREIVVGPLDLSNDTVRVTLSMNGGELVQGRMQWGHVEYWQFALQNGQWKPTDRIRGVVGDGFVRADKPRPPAPPNCPGK